MNPPKAVIAGAAVAGLMTGSLAVRTYAVGAGANAGVSIQTMDDVQKGKHACKGMNECKGQGGCKTADHACKGTPAKARAVVRPTGATNHLVSRWLLAARVRERLGHRCQGRSLQTRPLRQ